jgi:hypothetical protein
VIIGFISQRHPEVRALARLEGWQHHPLPSFEASRNSGSHLRMTIDKEFTEFP